MSLTHLPNTLDWPPNIKPYELARSGGTVQQIPDKLQARAWYLAWILQRIREECGGHPLEPQSGYRSPEYNKRRGSRPTSQHVQMRACDFVVYGLQPVIVYHIVEKMIEDGLIPEGGLGLYDSFVHYDFRGEKRRWRN